jgi:hypothetical protein
MELIEIVCRRLWWHEFLNVPVRYDPYHLVALHNRKMTHLILPRSKQSGRDAFVSAMLSPIKVETAEKHPGDRGLQKNPIYGAIIGAS